jgi:hypothetical protein
VYTEREAQLGYTSTGYNNATISINQVSELPEWLRIHLRQFLTYQASQRSTHPGSRHNTIHQDAK